MRKSPHHLLSFLRDLFIKLSIATMSKLPVIPSLSWISKRVIKLPLCILLEVQGLERRNAQGRSGNPSRNRDRLWWHFLHGICSTIHSHWKSSRCILGSRTKLLTAYSERQLNLKLKFSHYLSEKSLLIYLRGYWYSTGLPRIRYRYWSISLRLVTKVQGKSSLQRKTSQWSRIVPTRHVYPFRTD